MYEIEKNLGAPLDPILLNVGFKQLGVASQLSVILTLPHVSSWFTCLTLMFSFQVRQRDEVCQCCMFRLPDVRFQRKKNQDIRIVFTVLIVMLRGGSRIPRGRGRQPSRVGPNIQIRHNFPKTA